MNYVLNEANKTKIRELKKESAFTWEGMSTNEDNLKAIVDAMVEMKAWKSGVETVNFYTWKGKTFNEMYKLTGDNAYPEDCSFLSIRLEQLAGNAPMVKMQVGARWLDDIVSNNAYRQREINKRG